MVIILSIIFSSYCSIISAQTMEPPAVISGGGSMVTEFANQIEDWYYAPSFLKKNTSFAGTFSTFLSYERVLIGLDYKPGDKNFFISISDLMVKDILIGDSEEDISFVDMHKFNLNIFTKIFQAGINFKISGEVFPSGTIYDFSISPDYNIKIFNQKIILWAKVKDLISTIKTLHRFYWKKPEIIAGSGFKLTGRNIDFNIGVAPGYSFEYDKITGGAGCSMVFYFSPQDFISLRFGYFNYLLSPGILIKFNNYFFAYSLAFDSISRNTGDRKLNHYISFHWLNI